jgi:hypothetical protein
VDSRKAKVILYLNTNNLYGWAMTQYLPIGNFCWMKNEEELADLQRKIKSNSIPDDASEGYILKVKLKYPMNFMHNIQTIHLHQRECALKRKGSAKGSRK